MTCQIAWKLRQQWYLSGKDTDLGRLRLHFKKCQECRQHQIEMTEAAKKATMPALAEVEE